MMRPRMRMSTAAWSSVCAPIPVIVIAVPARKTQGSARVNWAVAVKARIASEITSVLARTSRVSPAIAGRNSIHKAPQMAPRPTVEVSIDKAAGADRGDGEQQQHRGDARMPAGIDIGLGRGLQHALGRGNRQCRKSA